MKLDTFQKFRRNRRIPILLHRVRERLVDSPVAADDETILIQRRDTPGEEAVPDEAFPGDRVGACQRFRAPFAAVFNILDQQGLREFVFQVDDRVFPLVPALDDAVAQVDAARHVAGHGEGADEGDSIAVRLHPDPDTLEDGGIHRRSRMRIDLLFEKC